jgi:short-subunit dehydrogenase
MALPAPTPGTTVAITGASSGIGAELARVLAGRGYDLTLIARRRDRLEELANELSSVEVRVEPCDLADAGARDQLIATLTADGPTVTGLLNNAGHGSHGRFHELDLDWERNMIELNVAALHHLTGAFVPRMVAQGTGAILNVASLAAFQPLPNMATYAATKAFVHSFSEAVHEELKGTGVSVTSLCPGPVHTEFGETAGVTSLESKAPEIVYVDARQVAEEAVDAMAAGRRSVVPTLKWKATALGGRLMPRTMLLPVARRAR